MRLRVSRFQGFLLVSAALIVTVVVAAGIAVAGFFERHVMAEEESQTTEVVQIQARQHLTPRSFQAGAADAQAFDGYLSGLPGVFRVKAFAPSGLIVWSNEPLLIGQTFPDNAYLQRALEGRVTTVLGTPRRSEHVFERTKQYIGEVYVPITFPGQAGVVGVVEAYKDMTKIVLDIQATQRRIWAVAGATGLMLHLALAFIVWKATEAERRAIDRLERQNRELTLLQKFTQSVLGPLDLGQVARSVVESAVQGLGLSSASLHRVEPDGGLALLACSPAGPPVPHVASDLAREAIDARRRAVRGAAVAVPLFTQRGTTYLFTGELSRPVPVDQREGRRTLEIMLDEAAIALSNVEIVLEIREAHERLAAILSGIADQMVIVDRDMGIVWMNAAAAATGERQLGQPCFEAMGLPPEACESCPAVRSMLSGSVERGGRTQKLPDGRTRYLDLVTAPLRDAAGRVHQVLEVARDITELMEMEMRLKETNQALLDAQAQLVEKERLAAVGEVVVGLHHAILNPLTGVLGALQVLKDQGLTTPEHTRAVADAEGEVRKIEGLIRRLRDLRRAAGTPYVGDTTMLDLESAPGEDPDRTR